ncbi:uncharacterized protein LOC121866219 isoform X2 [Homarus americanus]|uniref:uncharacterized protein LOC121866219 isoform X2 n=1 Tax=Homarus americanus TaxID=6706 RepID=UPI001C492CCE|nr:uncharacterized protein LOC121866219 isoform X2 [Homarus americanus]
MVALVNLLVLLPLLGHAALGLPLLADTNEPGRRGWPLTMQPSPRASFNNDSLQTLQWLRALLGDRPESSAFIDGDDTLSERPYTPPMPLSRTHHNPSLAKRDQPAKIPTMGLAGPAGVLSDMRNFFNELRTNLDSVEEVARSQENIGLLDRQQFLNLLAKYEAHMQTNDKGKGHPPPSANTRGRVFGYSNYDQPYAHSGLGK